MDKWPIPVRENAEPAMGSMGQSPCSIRFFSASHTYPYLSHIQVYHSRLPFPLSLSLSLVFLPSLVISVQTGIQWGQRLCGVGVSPAIISAVDIHQPMRVPRLAVRTRLAVRSAAMRFQ